MKIEAEISEGALGRTTSRWGGYELPPSCTTLGSFLTMFSQEFVTDSSVVRETFEADVAKACHHGSADFTDLFLRAVNPTAAIVSSGDNESYAHPRPDALGAFGKCGRGSRPLIFSTELARSVTQTT